MKNKFEYSELKYNLRQRVFSEPSGTDVRSDLVKYVSLLAVEAQGLPEDRLLGDDGHDIAMDICGALAFQGADGVEGDDWITEASEPVLFSLLSVSGELDANANNPRAWQSLFDLVGQLS